MALPLGLSPGIPVMGSQLGSCSGIRGCTAPQNPLARREVAQLLCPGQAGVHVHPSVPCLMNQSFMC